MSGKPKESEKLESEKVELDFSGCTTIEDCMERVSFVLEQANIVHQKQCSTRNRARNLLKSSHGITDADKALIVAQAVFPDHCPNFFRLKHALSPHSRLDDEDRRALEKALIKLKHEALISLFFRK